MLRYILFITLLLGTTTSWAQGNHQPDSTMQAKDLADKIKKDSIDKARAAGTEKPAPKAAGNAGSTADKPAKVNVDSTSLMDRYHYDLEHFREYYPAKGASNWRLWAAIAGGLILVFISRYLMYNTALCKDLCYDPATNNLRPADKRPFSYSKLQLFWWTVIILSTFLTYYIYTGYLISFTPSMVLLMGGGLAVAVFGKVIDNTQMNPEANPVPIRHQDYEDSKGLFTDILSDEGGITIHRYQAVVMNMIFGIAFIGQFLKSIFGHEVYPFLEFESWQLTLMGVSSAAF
ncbi:hypothetical protein [Paraflavitalea speifideaquila]|uniref:hypothetical protein n=1 Tax=Paraflavitalea speifideaquila TaxID=3076558 RepID=UPI0028ED317C|nr:hypothetical protein [Paraflavitalea speifideiaquila]